MCVLGDDVYWFDGDGETYLLDPTTGYTGEEMFADLEDNMKGADCNQETGIVYATSKNTDNRLQITSSLFEDGPFVIDSYVDLPTRVTAATTPWPSCPKGRRSAQTMALAAPQRGPFYAMTPSSRPAVNAATA